jgi:hypothetical protein
MPAGYNQRLAPRGTDRTTTESIEARIGSGNLGAADHRMSARIHSCWACYTRTKEVRPDKTVDVTIPVDPRRRRLLTRETVRPLVG